MQTLPISDLIPKVERMKLEKHLEGFTPTQLELFWSHDPFEPYPKSLPKPSYETVIEHIFPKLIKYIINPPGELEEKCLKYLGCSLEFAAKHFEKSEAEIEQLIRTEYFGEETGPVSNEELAVGARYILMQDGSISLPPRRDLWVYYVYGYMVPKSSQPSVI